MPSSQTFRNALLVSPQERARICAAIHWQIELELLTRSNAKREALLRLAIGLRPISRPIYRERSR